MSSDTRDALNIIDHRYFGDADPIRDARMDDYRAQMDIAQMVFDLRVASGLTQSELARRVGTTQSVISRLEDADYGGHSLKLLFRIARSLGKELRIQFVDSGVPVEAVDSTRAAA